MMTEIMGQTQNPCHVTTAHLGRRFAHLAIECSCLFDNQDTGFVPFALQHERGCRARKRAPDDHDIVIEMHRSKRMASLPLQSKSVERRKPVSEQCQHRSDYFD